MAAAVINHKKRMSHVGKLIQEFELSSMTSQQDETLTYNLQQKTPPEQVEFQVVTPPSDNSVLVGYHRKSQDSTSASTVVVRMNVEGGGAITGAVMRVRLIWAAQAPQDGSSIRG